ncbi:hypothetical protein ES705_38819 [subsurface metagenome]
MEEVIYYPGFEVQSEEWLKFALLYIDHLKPIIPESGDRYLSHLSKRLREETDLIAPHRPEYTEGCSATLDAITLVERMLRSPRRYRDTLGEGDFVAAWKTPENQVFTLFEEKFSNEWEHFCLFNRLGRSSPDGLRVARSLGLVYMSFLAQVISEIREMPTLTDHPRMDQISILTRKVHPHLRKRLRIAKGVLDLKVPQNLAGISIDKIISLRNEPDFKARLHAFHRELNTWITDVEEGRAEGNLFETRGSISSDFSDNLVKLGAEITTFGLGIWLLLSDPATTVAYVKEISAGTALTIGSVIAIRNGWKHSKTRRYTRKYLADLRTLC